MCGYEGGEVIVGVREKREEERQRRCGDGGENMTVGKEEGVTRMATPEEDGK